LETREAVSHLSEFVGVLVKARVKDKDAWRRWRKKPGSEALMERLFAYERRGKMPSVTALVSADFHPQEPLILLNYSPVAHNTLHAFPEGWTMPLRQCRGIVFDRRGRLAAKPFPKFFNYGEHPETTKLPREPFTATLKHDGHLAIIFKHGGRMHLTTRGSFMSPTGSTIGAALLERAAAQGNWKKEFPEKATLLAEMIHPRTKVHVDYRGQEELIVIGAYDLESLFDLPHDHLSRFADSLGLRVTETWEGKRIDDLKRLMKDRSVENREGYVVRYASDLRVKFKFETYIGLMVGAKLNYAYLMNRVLAGTLKKMISTLPEEGYAEAKAMVARLEGAAKLPTEAERKAYLYDLDSAKKDNQYYRGICRKYLKHLETRT
jgi:RNA ligase